MEQLVTFSPNSDFKLAHYPLLAFVAPGAGLCTLEGMNENAFRVPVGRFARVLLTVVAMTLSAAAPCRADKAALSAAIEARAEPTWQAALQIWEWAEPGYQEEKSSALLAQMLEHEGFKVEARRRRHSHGFYRRGGRGAAGDRDPGRVRRSARTFAAGRARAIATRSGGIWPRLRASFVRHRIGRCGDGRGRAIEEGPSAGHGALLWLSGRGGRSGQGVHGPGRLVQRLRRGIALASGQPQRGRRCDVPGANRGEIPFSRHEPMPRPRPSRGVRPWTRWN